MPQCPVCQSEVADDFGLIECPECKTPLFVQMDGSVQSMATEPGETAETIEMPAEMPAEIPAEFPAELQAPDLQTAYDSQPAMSEPSDGIAEEILVQEAPSQDFEPTPAEEVMQEALPQEEPVAAEPSAEDVDAFFDDAPEPAAESAPATPIHDLSQLANSTEVDAQAGSIRYNISVTGIDTAEIRKEFRDLLTDRRFLWDVDAILKSIRSGKVKMQNITAVKAILLVQRLRGLPVHVQWEQHVVHQD